MVGHNTATIQITTEKAFELGEKFITASKNTTTPASLARSVCKPADKDMNYYIYVSPLISGGTNVHVSVGHPYGNATWRKPMSSGRRIAVELRMAVEQDRLRSFDMILISFENKGGKKPSTLERNPLLQWHRNTTTGRWHPETSARRSLPIAVAQSLQVKRGSFHHPCFVP